MSAPRVSREGLLEDGRHRVVDHRQRAARGQLALLLDRECLRGREIGEASLLHHVAQRLGRVRDWWPLACDADERAGRTTYASAVITLSTVPPTRSCDTLDSSVMRSSMARSYA
eukprot:5414296-Prymnesium_polylepis.1